MRMIEHTPERWAKFLRVHSPITESIVPLDSRGRRDWNAVGDETLLSYARWKIREGEMDRINELYAADGGLVAALQKRDLTSKLELRKKVRYWRTVGDDELLALAEMIIKGRGIRTRQELYREDSGLCQKLRRRKLMDKLGLGGRGRWFRIGSDELVEHAKAFIAENGIYGRKELQAADNNLYLALLKRGRMGDVGLADRRGDVRRWSSMNDGALVEFTGRFMAENGLKGRAELKRADGGLYSAIMRRGLIRALGVEDMRGERKDWHSLGKEGMIRFALTTIQEHGIITRKELERANRKLYNALRKRGFLDAVFSKFEYGKLTDAVRGVIGALESFGDGS